MAPTPAAVCWGLGAAGLIPAAVASVDAWIVAGERGRSGGGAALGYMLGETRGQGARWVGVREARTGWQVGPRASGVAVCGACCGQQAQLLLCFIFY